MGVKTVLFEEHKALGANIVDFAGWEMPVYYSTPLKEHIAVREHAGLFDISHMGEIFVEGRDALKLVQLLVSRNCGKMRAGEMRLGVMCNESGGILDDLTVYRFGEEKFMIVVNAGTIERDLEWIKGHAGNFDCKISDKSVKTAKLDLQGPKAKGILQEITGTKLAEIKYYGFFEIEVAGVFATVSRSGYTGEDGFELYFDAKKAAWLWRKILKAGAVPCGLAARDTLRLEAGMPLYGHELSEEKTPFESGYGWTVGFEKEFVGKQALKKQKAEGVKEKLVGFEMVDRAIAREGCKIFVQGEKSGFVTSGSFSPSLKKNIGLGYIGVDFASVGQEIEIEVREKKFRAKIAKKPFYRREK